MDIIVKCKGEKKLQHCQTCLHLQPNVSNQIASPPCPHSAVVC